MLLEVISNVIHLLSCLLKTKSDHTMENIPNSSQTDLVLSTPSNQISFISVKLSDMLINVYLYHAVDFPCPVINWTYGMTTMWMTTNTR